MTQVLDPAVVGQEVVDEYQRDGAVVVRGVFSESDVDSVRLGIERNLAQPSERQLVASDPDDPGLFVEDFCNWQRIPEYRQFLESSPAADIAGALMGSQEVRLYHDHMLVKEPRTRQATPWHQDQPYYNIDGQQNCSMWMPVDPVPVESSLEFLAGSHRGPWLMPRTFREAQAKWFPEGSLGELPDIEADRGAFDIKVWALEPGDAVFFHMLTLHHAGSVPGRHRRRAFSLRFLGDDIRHAPRSWKTSPEFPGLADELPAGAPMDHELFPLLRTHS
jgi:ectoine hydroxylase-related dioxygenase (phytanoyl-CoA dioxygenase family)